MMVPGREHVVALSGIAVIVNPANQLAQLDRAQLADIFAGTVTDWSALKGAKGTQPARIHVYAADDKMGLADLFRTLVLEKRPYAADAKRLASLKEITEAVALDPQGIGYVTLAFVRGTRAVPISEGDEPPLVPTAFTLATEDYFLTHRLYFYALPSGDSQHLVRFLQFALGPEGQAVVKRSGYVELSVASAPREPPRDAPPAYAKMVQGATRLSSTFRFEPGSADFDARALMDLERVTTYLIENRTNGSAVRVMGFADSMGSPAINLGLSQARAQQVEKALAQRGIAGVAVQGFGHALPVASNATKDGRERNRRVEIWVSR
jgi:phosphate transport system substrate-binding protein